MLILDQELTPELLKATVELPNEMFSFEGKVIQIQIQDAKLSAVNYFGKVHYLTSEEVVLILNTLGYPYGSVSGLRCCNNAIWEIN